ncbi:MAG: hypothetical protein AAFV53_10580 [Myxococcota bacterium]
MNNTHTEAFGPHLAAAIQLNRDRMPRYAALTGGRSRAISRTLIGVERLLWVSSGLVDGIAASYQRDGVPLLEGVFVSMALAPAFVERRPVHGQFRPLPSDLRGRLYAALRHGGFGGVERRARAQIAALSDQMSFQWMTRHMLESIVAIAHSAPETVAAADAVGRQSPAWFLRWILRQHIHQLWLAALLDGRAAPIQAEGVAIIAQDVPPILEALGI